MTNPLPAGYSFIAGSSSTSIARAVLHAAEQANVDPGLIHFSPDRGGYVVPDAVAAAYASPTGDDDEEYLPAEFRAALTELRDDIANQYVHYDGSALLQGGATVPISGGGSGADIDDATTSTTKVWSSSKVNTALGTKQAAGSYATASALTSGLAGKADLVAGVIPNSQIPALALTNGIPVADQAAMLALPAGSSTGQARPGSVAIRADGAGSFLLNGTDPSVLSNWVRINAPTDSVTSVAGKSGTVILGPSDVGAEVAGAAAAAQAYAIARSHHTGTQSADTVIDGTANKAYTAAEKTKLASVAANATANRSDASTDQAISDAVATIPAATPATTSTAGTVKLAGDLAGTSASPALAAVGTAGTYGSASAIPVLTTDAKGRVTGASTVTPGFGFVFYDPTTGWPAQPATGRLVFYSVGYPAAPAPTTGSDNSVWFFTPAS